MNRLGPLDIKLNFKVNGPGEFSGTIKVGEKELPARTHNIMGKILSWLGFKVGININGVTLYIPKKAELQLARSYSSQSNNEAVAIGVLRSMIHSAAKEGRYEKGSAVVYKPVSKEQVQACLRNNNNNLSFGFSFLCVK